MLLVVLPIPAVVLLTLLTLYHLTPLIHLLPTKTIQLLPLLHNLSNIIPHPRSNLPREFFNLPPRPRTPASSYSPHVSSALGVRGKLVLLLAGQAGLSLACGWGYLLHGEGRGGAAMLAISIAPLPATVLLLAVYSINANQTIRSYESSTAIRQLGFGTGGITHSTIFPRNLPLSLIPTAVIAIICALVPKHARIVLLVSTSAFVLILIALSAVGGYRTYFVPKRGVIRLREARTNEKAKEGEEEERGVQAMMDSDSWVTSPCALTLFQRANKMMGT
jgi:hypothetical protein